MYTILPQFQDKKSVIEGREFPGNCPELDIILILDKFLYLVAALHNPQLSFAKKNWQQCCEEASAHAKYFRHHMDCWVSRLPIPLRI
jgi:hypothetical protein